MTELKFQGGAAEVPERSPDALLIEVRYQAVPAWPKANSHETTLIVFVRPDTGQIFRGVFSARAVPSAQDHLDSPGVKAALRAILGPLWAEVLSRQLPFPHRGLKLF